NSIALKMDPASQCTPEHTPARLSARGIFITGNGYLCLICNLEIVTLTNVIKHFANKKHCDKLHDVRLARSKVDGFFRCNKCTNYATESWKNFLIHFTQQNHFYSVKESNNRYISYVSNVTLVRNLLIEQDPGNFFCLFCNELIIGGDSVFAHIEEKKHEELLQTFTAKYPPEILYDDQCRKWAKNFICVLAHSEFYCALCDSLIKGKLNCAKHIISHNHVTNVVTSDNINYQLLDNCIKRKKLFDSYEYPGFETSTHSPVVAKTMCDADLMVQGTHDTPQKFSARGTNHISSSIHVENMLMIDEFNYEPPCNEIQRKENPGPLKKTVHENSIMGPVPSTGHFISEHISSHQHMQLRKTADSMKSQEITNSGNTFENLSSSWETIESSLASWEVCGTQSQSCDLFKSSSSSWESSDKISNSWETISTSSSYSAQQAPMMFEIPKSLIPLISENVLQRRKAELYCVACEVHIRSVDSFLGHTNSKRHSARLKEYKTQIAQKNQKLPVTLQNIACSNVQQRTVDSKPFEDAKRVADKTVSRPSKLLEVPQDLVPLISKHQLNHLEKEIYCKACDAHLLTPTSLIDHTRSKNHIARLGTYRDQIAQSSKKSSSNTSEDSRAPNTPARSINQKPLQSESENVARPDSQHSTKLFDIPKNLESLITKHSLDHLKNELYCKACKAHLRGPSSIVAHTKSKYHIATLKYYRDKVWRKDETLLSTSDYSNVTNASVPTISKDPPQSVTRSSEKPVSVLSEKAFDIYCKVCKTHIETPEAMENHMKSEQHVVNFKSGNVQEKKKELFANEMQLSQVNNSNKNYETQIPYALKELEKLKHAVQSNIAPDIKNNTTVSKTKKVRVQNRKKSNTSNHESQIPEIKCNFKAQETVVKNSKCLDNLRNLGQNQVGDQTNDSKALKKGRKKMPLPKYLHADMQHIYSMNPEKLRIIKLSCQLCFPKTSSLIYCLVCQRSVPCNLQTFYEHICTLTHTANLAEMESNDQHFINCPDQFSDLTLAKELSQEMSDENIQCFACDLSILNDHADILEHVTEDFHQERKQSWNKVMDKILQDILVQMESTWYTIQKYWCQLCDIQFSAEFFFAEHLEGTQHQKRLKKTGISAKRLIYDACVSCATLWLGFPTLYTQHCEQPLHKYLVQRGDYVKCVLPNQAKALLENAEAEAISLIALSDQVLNVQKTKVDSLLKCLEDTVKVEFPKAKAYPLGSRVSGLGFPDSDIDVFLDCGTYDGKNNSKNYQIDIIHSVANCLHANAESWEIDEILVSTRTPIIKLHHRNTELSCDVSFKNGLSVENTKLLKCFIDNYPLCRQLMLFLKRWLSLCSLSGPRYIANYAICWCVIFYLQVESILPSVASLIAKENKSKIISNWETGICATFNVSGHEYTFTKLLYGFFVFYSNFEYRNSVVCPLLGRTILKSDFEDLDLLPSEMRPYVDHVIKNRNDDSIELFRIHAEMCIQDPYDLSHNLTKSVPKFTLNRFRRLSAASADILKTFLQC
ncbi:uncharacterized protein LOC124413642, partial [Diprion similis]|uniref:uncharacterized protein LOC124413642 n=1 Tax=Diprion similis TaxID=362088 RepID=UPI001EF91AC4